MKLQLKQWIQIMSTIFLMFAGDIGDYILSQQVIQSYRKIHAVLDNVIHLLIGLLSWIIVDPYSIVNCSTELILVCIGSSLIDIDHFIAAKSARIEAAMHAPFRGPFHCTGLLLALSLMLIPINIEWTFILLISFVPHHLRDSVRRGIYLYPPLVHTKPIPNHAVRIILIIFPWFIRYLRIKCNFSDGKIGMTNDNLFSSFTV